MPVTYSVEPPSLFLIFASGVVTFPECIDVLDALGKDGRFGAGSKLLIDGRDVTKAPLRPELRQIARKMRDLRDQGMVATVIVTNPGFVYGVARMFAMFAELLGFRVGVCLTIEDAFEWVASEPPGRGRSPA